ncbi:MAG: hypothetical protein CM1200mP2_31410 [Planctomycetaceae bacterium]|nr:MAG: hypothetical protein CM1200mP2_31410 [Planctomycetaceae bacterium]
MYSESERPWFVYVFVVSGLVAGACYARWGFAIAEKGWAPENGLIPFVATGIPALVVLGFFTRASWTYFVREDGFGLQFGFTGWSVRFDYSDIIEAKRADVSWKSWGGFGWRWRPGRIGYLVRSGPGVEIATKRSRRTYTFNCQDRDALLASLGNAGVTIAAHRD